MTFAIVRPAFSTDTLRVMTYNEQFLPEPVAHKNDHGLTIGPEGSRTSVLVPVNFQIEDQPTLRDHSCTIGREGKSGAAHSLGYDVAAFP
jgi:hypothetical protein